MSHDGTPVSYRVIAEYHQQALTMDFSRRELTKKTEFMDYAATTLINDKEGHAGIGIMGFTMSVSAYNNLKDINNIKVDQTKSFSEKTTNKKEYNPDFLQIVEHITTEITINDLIILHTTSEYIDAIPKSSPKSTAELEDMAKQYIFNNWAMEKGEILGGHGHIYQETMCPQLTIPKPPGYCESNNNCVFGKACINSFCTDPCSTKTCIMPNEECSVRAHEATCHCKTGYVRSSTGQCVHAPPGHCLPGQHCKAGDCCALGSSCNTCPYGYVINNNECAGKGNYQCNWSNN